MRDPHSPPRRLLTPALMLSAFLVCVVGQRASGQTTTAPASAPATQASDPLQPPEGVSPDEWAAFLKAGEEFDLDAFIKSLNPPTVEEIIKSLEPIPTREQILDDLQHPERRPKPPVLPDEVAKQVQKLTQQIEELERQGAIGDDEKPQQEALEQALRLAERVIELRTEAGQPKNWYEVLDASQRVATLKHMRTVAPGDRRKLTAASECRSKMEELYFQGHHERATAIARSQLSVYGRLCHGDHHPELALSLHSVANCLQKLGRLVDAESLHRHALAMFRRLFRDDHVYVAVSLGSLASVLYVRGAVDEAEPLYRHALAMQQRLFPAGHPHVAESMNNLAAILNQCGAIAEAEQLLRHTLAMNRHLYSGDHGAVAVALNNLAMVLHARGALAEAEPLSRESLAIYRRLYRGDHPEVARGLNNLAYTLQARGALTEAETLSRQALGMVQRLVPGDHADVAQSQNTLANILRARGALAEAETLYRDALSMRRRLFPGDHPNVATSVHNLAGILGTRGALAQAETLSREALAMAQRLFPGDHPYVPTHLNSVSKILHERGALEQAEPLVRDALAMWQRLLPDDHPSVALGLNNLAMLLQARGELAEAEMLFRQAMAMVQRHFSGDHPDVADCLYNLASSLCVRGDLREAEVLFRDALDMRKRLFPGDHADVARSAWYLAFLAWSRADFQAGELLYAEAFGMLERLRTDIVGAEAERATFSQKLGLTDCGKVYASALARLEKPAIAATVLERSRSRAFLDLLSGSDREAAVSSDQTGERSAKLNATLVAEETARIELASAEARLPALRREHDFVSKRNDLDDNAKTSRLGAYDEQIAAQDELVKSLRRKLSDAGAMVNVELRGLIPDAQPLTTETIRAGLLPGEVILCLAWSDEHVLVLTVPREGEGEVQAHQLADGKEPVRELAHLAARVRTQIAARPRTHDRDAVTEPRQFLERLVPPAARQAVASAQRLVVIPDGPLNGIPLEALVAYSADAADPILPDAPMAYAASATVYLNRRASRDSAARGPSAGIDGARATTATAVTAVVLGDPIFDRNRPPEPEYPKQGVLIAKAVPDGPADKAGLRRGDVLLAYDDKHLADSAALTAVREAVEKAIAAGDRSADALVKLTYWRNGERAEVALPPGKLGVQLDPAKSPAEGLKDYAMLTRGEAEKVAEINALDRVRLFGGSLPSLPGTRREAEAIAEMVRKAGGDVSLLVGEDAMVGKLAAAAPQARYVHLATHGLTGSAERPYDASVALTQPERPSPDDIGFLTLDHMIRKWRGKLAECDLVVLSACDTQRGVKVGDSVMALPWGFFYAGAPAVIASLWKVDDAATALLMTRLYQNLLGSFEQSRTLRGRNYAAGDAMSKLDALDEAKAWLRGLSRADAEHAWRAIGLDVSGLPRGGPEPPTGAPVPADESRAQTPERPYQHPYYWAAFILIGSPE